MAKERFGKRVFVLTDKNSKSILNSKKMWFEMQRVGIECVLCSFATPFPTQVGIIENASLFRRTGCTSILSIGNGSVADFCKGIQSYLTSSNDDRVKRQIPLIVVANTISPVYSTETYGILHESDDVIVQTESLPPQVEIYSYQCSHLTIVYR